MLVPVIAEVLAGLVILWFAVRLRQGRISRNSTVGVRTPSTMRSDAAFETANKAPAPPTGTGGVVMAVCGVLVQSFRGTWPGPLSSVAWECSWSCAWSARRWACERPGPWGERGLSRPVAVGRAGSLVPPPAGPDYRLTSRPMRKGPTGARRPKDASAVGLRPTELTSP